MMCGSLSCSEEDKRFFQDAVRTSTLDIVQRMREITIVMSMLEEELQQQGVTTEDLLGMTGLGPLSCLFCGPSCFFAAGMCASLERNFCEAIFVVKGSSFWASFVLCPSLEALVEDPRLFWS
jgi:hypothetical protein